MTNHKLIYSESSCLLECLGCGWMGRSPNWEKAAQLRVEALLRAARTRVTERINMEDIKEFAESRVRLKRIIERVYEYESIPEPMPEKLNRATRRSYSKPEVI